MRNPRPLFRALALAVLGAFCVPLTMSLEGCTVIGLMAGAASDRAREGGAEKLFEVRAGQAITLVLWDRSVLEGRFAGWVGDSAATGCDSSGYEPPGGAVLRLQTKAGERAIPTERIARVVIRGPSGAAIGLLVGLAIDVMVIRNVDLHGSSQSEGCEGPTDLPPLLTKAVPPPGAGGVPPRESPPRPLADRTR